MPPTSRTALCAGRRGCDKPAMAEPVEVFDRLAVRRRRARAGTMAEPAVFLAEAIADRLCDRLDDLRRTFASVLVIGALGGRLGALVAGRPGVRMLTTMDLSEALARRAARPAVVADEEALPFAAEAFDLVLGAFSLHAVNDLPGALVQIRRALKPDGLLLAAMAGGRTLHELRRALIEAEAAHEGGASPRVAPFTDVPDAGGLLQRAGFALPVVDSDTITVTWDNPLALMADLRAMGEANALSERLRRPTRRATLLDAAERYRALFADAEGRIPATFEILTMTGWAPGPDQQRPLRPGSAAARLAEALGSEERSAGEAADPRKGRADSS